jgi:hypothetical protein
MNRHLNLSKEAVSFVEYKRRRGRDQGGKMGPKINHQEEDHRKNCALLNFHFDEFPKRG